MIKLKKIFEPDIIKKFFNKMSDLSSYYGGRKSLPPPTEEYIVHLYESGEYVGIAWLFVDMVLNIDAGKEYPGTKIAKYWEDHVDEVIPSIFDRALKERNTLFFKEFFGSNGPGTDSYMFSDRYYQFYSRHSDKYNVIHSSIITSLFYFIIKTPETSPESPHFLPADADFFEEIIGYVFSKIPMLSYEGSLYEEEMSWDNTDTIISEDPIKTEMLENLLIKIMDSIGEVDVNDREEVSNGSHFIYYPYHFKLKNAYLVGTTKGLDIFYANTHCVEDDEKIEMIEIIEQGLVNLHNFIDKKLAMKLYQINVESFEDLQYYNYVSNLMYYCLIKKYDVSFKVLQQKGVVPIEQDRYADYNNEGIKILFDVWIL